MAFATLSAATFHWSSSGAPMAASEGERKSVAAPGATPRLASTRAHRRSTSASRASSDTTSASGSRSRHRAKNPPYAENPKSRVSSLYKPDLSDSGKVIDLARIAQSAISYQPLVLADS